MHISFGSWWTTSLSLPVHHRCKAHPHTVSYAAVNSGSGNSYDNGDNYSGNGKDDDDHMMVTMITTIVKIIIWYYYYSYRHWKAQCKICFPSFHTVVICLQCAHPHGEDTIFMWSCWKFMKLLLIGNGHMTWQAIWLLLTDKTWTSVWCKKAERLVSRCKKEKPN